MKVIFDEEKERKMNQLNKGSVKLRITDLDRIDDYEDAVIFNDYGDKIFDISLYMPEDKAYICINRLHFSDLYKEDKIKVMKQFINHILCPYSIKYLASTVYIDCRESGISDNELERIGFYNKHFNCHLFQLLNRNFEQYVEASPIDSEIKESVLQDYGRLKIKEKDHFDQIRRNMELAKEELMDPRLNEIMLEAKKIEIKHYEDILGSNQDKDR